MSKLINLCDGNKIIYNYSGPIDKDIIYFFTNKIKEFYHQDKSLNTKLIKTFVELTQNVNNYSIERFIPDESSTSLGIGKIIIKQTENYYEFTISNAITNSDLEILEKKCKIINSLNRTTLKEYKRKLLNVIPHSNEGAHIGLIMIALLTNKSIDYSVENKDTESSYINIRISV